MACYAPNRAFIGKKKPESEKMEIVWKRSQSLRDEELYLPCGKCVGCKLQYAKHWAIRCINEAQFHEKNCFITLTYSDEFLPKNGSLDKREFPLFMKKLRKYSGEKIRYFHGSEYGEEKMRPHYHALLFGIDFDDKELYAIRNGKKLYTSKELGKIWNKGFVSVGAVEMESASYVARYSLKKVYKEFEKLPKGLEPEKITMSRKPGIGFRWFQKYKSDVYPDDFIVTNSGRSKPPRYYDNLLDKEELEQIKEKRKKFGKRLTPIVVKGKIVLINENTDLFKLKTREIIKLKQVEKLKRGMV